MRLINYLNRPEYIFRPRQLYRRILRSSPPDSSSNIKFFLPWGVPIQVCPGPGEVIGRSLSAMGIYDLVVTEVLWRLIDTGEIAIDVGASIGYMTSIMAKRVGASGKVWCFEPNPEVYQELSENIKTWQDLGWNQIYAQNLALSNQAGIGVLSIPQRNREEAALISPTEISSHNQVDLKTYTVSLATLDELVNTSTSIGVIKIDVEGHELEVLQGASKLISKQKIRDIIFEDHHGYPSPVSQFLENHNYTVFRIWKGFWKPLIEPPTKQRTHPWEPPSYLATKDSSRAIERLKQQGWSSLQNT